MSSTSDLGAWITPREAIVRLGAGQSDFATLHNILTRLQASAITGEVRAVGYAFNDRHQSGRTLASVMDAFALDTFKLQFAVAVRRYLGIGDGPQTPFFSEFTDYDIAAGNFTIRSQHVFPSINDDGDEVTRIEDWVMQYTQIRFLEEGFIKSFAEASKVAPLPKGKRGGTSTAQVSDQEITLWLVQCGINDSKLAWNKFRRDHAERSCTKEIFMMAWREAHPGRGRGRPKKV